MEHWAKLRRWWGQGGLCHGSWGHKELAQLRDRMYTRMVTREHWSQQEPEWGCQREEEWRSEPRRDGGQVLPKDLGKPSRKKLALLKGWILKAWAGNVVDKLGFHGWSTTWVQKLENLPYVCKATLDPWGFYVSKCIKVILRKEHQENTTVFNRLSESSKSQVWGINTQMLWNASNIQTARHCLWVPAGTKCIFLFSPGDGSSCNA